MAPSSHVVGGEIAIAFGPFAGFTVALNGTHIETRVDSNPATPTGPFGNAGSFVGQSFPFTPKWQGAANLDYRFAISPTLNGFGGASVTARTATVASLLSGAPAVAAQEALFRVPPYTLVDLRIGIETADKQWRLELWGRNVTNKYYTMGTKKTADFVTQFTGMPATYGLRVAYRL